MFGLVGKRFVGPGLGRTVGGSKRYASYSLPSIPLLEKVRISQEGFGGLFSHEAVNQLWFKRGEQLVQNLNHLLEENSVRAPSDLNELITLTFSKPDLHGIYSYASMLHNLQFTLESLRPQESAQSNAGVKRYGFEEILATPSIATQFTNEPKNAELRDWIISSFGSIAEFRTLLLNSAHGIKGDGLVWLVAQATYSESNLKSGQFGSQPSGDLKYSSLAIMNTYNAGIVDDSIRSGQITKLKQQKEAKIASLKKKLQDKKDASSSEPNSLTENDDSGLSHLENQEVESNDLKLGSIEEAEAATAYSDRKLLPLLAIDASPRNYLLDYGVFGKQRYLDNVWDCIDWDIVSKRSPMRFKKSFEMD